MSKNSKVVASQPKEVTTLFATLIDNDEVYPHYKKEVIDFILDTLRKKQMKNEYIEICNRLIAKHRFEYKDYIDKYKNNQ